MNMSINILTAISAIILFSTLYILKDTIREVLFGGKNYNLKG